MQFSLFVIVCIEGKKCGIGGRNIWNRRKKFGIGGEKFGIGGKKFEIGRGGKNL